MSNIKSWFLEAERQYLRVKNTDLNKKNERWHRIQGGELYIKSWIISQKTVCFLFLPIYHLSIRKI